MLTDVDKIYVVRIVTLAASLLTRVKSSHLFLLCLDFSFGGEMGEWGWPVGMRIVGVAFFGIGDVLQIHPIQLVHSRISALIPSLFIFQVI